MSAVTNNFRVANERRTAAAAEDMCAKVRHALNLLGSQVPPRWAAVGRLRLEHPTLCLGSLGAMADPPLSKNAVASILRRLARRAEQLEAGCAQ